MVVSTNIKGYYLRITASNSNVTGTCYHLELLMPNGKTEEYLVDCGSFMEPETIEYNNEFLFNPRKIKAVLLTHYHMDHYGQIPVLYEQGYYGNVYSSEVTIERFKEKAMANFYSERRSNGENLSYQESTVIYMLQKAIAIPFDEVISLSDHVKVRIFPNNHARGAVMFLFICEYQEHYIYTLFTGDYKYGKFPKGLEEYRDKPIAIVTEGTYGIQERPEPQFVEFMEKSVCFGYTPILLSTGDDRYKDILEKIDEVKGKGIIPKNTTVYVEVKRRNAEALANNNQDETVRYISKPTEKVEAIYDKERKIIVVSTRGGISFFMQELVSNDNMLILFTNYISDGVRARAWIDAPRLSEITIGSEKYVKKARVYEIKDFCGHSFASEILSFLCNFSNITGVFIGHGDKEAKRSLVQYLAKKESSLKNSVFVLRRDITYQICEFECKYYK